MLIIWALKQAGSRVCLRMKEIWEQIHSLLPGTLLVAVFGKGGDVPAPRRKNPYRVFLKAGINLTKIKRRLNVS
jgi:hypothetical protein